MLINKTRLALLIIGLIAIFTAMGCSGGANPISSSTGEILSSVDATDDVEGTREVADGVYSGTLTDSDGDPFAWAELYLDDEIAGWTEEDGSFIIYGVEETQEYEFEARIDDEVVFSTTITPAERSGQGIGDPDPEIERGTVWGFVRDGTGPVNRALVIVFNASQNFGLDFTDDEGRYRIPDAPAGPGVVLAFAPQHAVARDIVFVIPDGEVQKNLFIPLNIDKGLVGGFVLTGPVEDPRPVPHARVDMKPVNVPDAQPITVFTNRHGIYKFPPVPTGPHGLLAQAPCFNDGHRVIGVHPGRNMVNFHLEAVGCGGVEGQVTDEDGEPVPEAAVRLAHPNPDDPDRPFIRWELTGPNGWYRFNPVIPGLYKLDCGKEGYERYIHPDPVQVYPDQFTVIDITLIEVNDGGGG